MLDHFVEGEASFTPSISAGYLGAVRRHLAEAFVAFADRERKAA